MFSNEVNWGKIVRVSAAVLAIASLAVYWTVIIVRAAKDEADPRTRDEQEFIELFNETTLDDGISIEDGVDSWRYFRDDRDWQQKNYVLALPEGNEGSVLIKRRGSTKPATIYELTIEYDGAFGAYTKQIVDGLLTVFEPDYFTAEPALHDYFADEPYAYADIVKNCQDCDANPEYYKYYSHVTTSLHSTCLTLESSFYNKDIIKKINLEFTF